MSDVGNISTLLSGRDKPCESEAGMRTKVALGKLSVFC